MAKSGKYSAISGRHSREGFPQWQIDQEHNKHASKKTRIWIPVEVDVVEDFRSNVLALRPHPAEGWGYRIAPILAVDKPSPLVIPKERGRGRPRKRNVEGRALVAGDPDIDGGAGLMVPMEDGDTTVPMENLNEDDDPFSNALDRAASILATYDYTDVKTRMLPPNGSRKKKGDDDSDLVETDVTYIRSRKPKGKGAVAVLERRTIDVSPDLSRAVQRMIEDGLVAEAREILDGLVIPLSSSFEGTFPGSKVVAAGWHVRSGQLHLDLWVHSTKLETVLAGPSKDETLIRSWDADGLNHYGPGSGICAWTRHIAALGDEAPDLCPGIVAEVDAALKREEERAIERGRPGVANRDVESHRNFDVIVGAALPVEYVERGMGEYREHLRNMYRDGDPRLAKITADPVKEQRRRDQLARAMRETRATRKAVASLDKREAAISKKEAEYQEMFEPVSVAAVAEALRFAPQKEEGEFLRETPQKSKPSIFDHLLIKGQSFVLSIVGSKAVAKEGVGALGLLLAIDPKARLDKAMSKLAEWFPKKRHAIMLEAIERHGSPLLMEMMKPEPDAGKQDPKI